MSGAAIAGIIAGTSVEVAHAERMGDGDLLVCLITDPTTWVCVRAGVEADAIEREMPAYALRRLAIPMPPQACLMFERPDDAAAPDEQEPRGRCELCTASAETRPYGPNGEEVCFDCDMKAEAATTATLSRRFAWNRKDER